MSEIFQFLSKIGDSDVLLTSTPEVLDFTKSSVVTITIHTKDCKIDIPLPEKDVELRQFGGMLCHHLGGKRVILGWNTKNIYSYFLGKLDIPLVLDSAVYDLQVLEGYIGIDNGAKPNTFLEAKDRLGRIIKHSSWKDLKNIYTRIYNSLISKVIPEIETVGIVHQKQRKKLHAYYEIAGQLNGRMKCKKGYEAGFNPHSIMPEDRALMRPPYFDNVFMCLDYKHMEVAVLQWLSQDSVLGEILTSDSGVYEGIWTILMGTECKEEDRQRCKDMFLPIVYGMGVEALSERMKIPVLSARNLMDLVNFKFNTAVRWVKRQQDLFSDGVAKDVFGRIRYFSEHYYRIRNFVVQSPASLFCLDKLATLKADLKDTAKVAFHIHDGYFLSVHRTEVNKVRDLAIKSLEKESDLFGGLKLKVSCKIGLNLLDLV